MSPAATALDRGIREIRGLFGPQLQGGLVQHFKEDYHYLMGRIPGIRDMVEKFK